MSFPIRRRYKDVKTVTDYNNLVEELLFKNDTTHTGINTNNYVQRSDELAHLFKLAVGFFNNDNSEENLGNTNGINLFKIDATITYQNILNNNLAINVVPRKLNDIYVLIYLNYTIYLKCNTVLNWVITHIERNNYYESKIIQSNYTVNYDVDGLLIIAPTVNNVILTLPQLNTIPYKKSLHYITIKKATALNVTINCHNTNTIDLTTQTYNLNTGESITLTPFDNTNWIII
jgi:hypothetical protein